MLNVLTREQAVQTVCEQTQAYPLSVETVKTAESLGRTLAQDIISDENIPCFSRSTVDGYAVLAADTFGAGNAMPAQLEVVGEVLMGEAPEATLQSGQCIKIPTGGMLPAGADAAVMIEHTDNSENLCLVYRPVAPYENITKAGDDIAFGKTVLKRGTVITAAAIGVLAALGIQSIPVYRKPVIAIISTGDEIAQGKPQPGQIRDINTDLLSAAAKQNGCDVLAYGVVKDQKDAIRTAVQNCLKQADAVLISGGSSAGAKDMTADIIATLGTVFFHGIAMKPGKPTIFGTVGQKPVFGLPGHPLAAYFVFRLIVGAYIRKLLHQREEIPHQNAVLAVNVPSNHGREEFLCIQYNEKNEVIPIHAKSGIISVLAEAQGFIRIERNTEGLNRGTNVKVYEL